MNNKKYLSEILPHKEPMILIDDIVDFMGGIMYNDGARLARRSEIDFFCRRIGENGGGFIDTYRNINYNV